MWGAIELLALLLVWGACALLPQRPAKLQRLEDVLPIPHNDTMAVVVILENATMDSVEVFVDAGARPVRVGVVAPKSVEPFSIPGSSMGPAQIVTVSFRIAGRWHHEAVWRIARGPFILARSIGHPEPGTRS